MTTTGLHDAPRRGVERAAEILGLALTEGTSLSVAEAIGAVATALDRIADWLAILAEKDRP